MRLPTILALTMIACTSWGRIRQGLGEQVGRACLTVLVAVMLVACSLPALPERMPQLPELPQLPQVPQLPGIPTDLDQVQDLLTELGLPNLSELGDVPGLDALPALGAPPGGLVLQGPLEVSLAAGDTIPGTDIRLITPGRDVARFRIAGLEAERRIADSLDFDGAWPGIEGVTYTLRLRVYHLGERQVRAAGVQRVVIRDIQPQQGTVALSGHRLTFPHSVAADRDALFPGMTLGYRGRHERGAELTGLAATEYPYRKVGDSVVWRGRLRTDIPVEYNLRVLFYAEGSARLGGVAQIALPNR